MLNDFKSVTATVTEFFRSGYAQNGGKKKTLRRRPPDPAVHDMSVNFLFLARGWKPSILFEWRWKSEDFVGDLRQLSQNVLGTNFLMLVLRDCPGSDGDSTDCDFIISVKSRLNTHLTDLIQMCQSRQVLLLDISSCQPAQPPDECEAYVKQSVICLLKTLKDVLNEHREATFLSINLDPREDRDSQSKDALTYKQTMITSNDIKVDIDVDPPAANLTSLFGLVLGFPVVYWFSADSLQEFNRLCNADLLVFSVNFRNSCPISFSVPAHFTSRFPNAERSMTPRLLADAWKARQFSSNSSPWIETPKNSRSFEELQRDEDAITFHISRINMPLIAL